MQETSLNSFVKEYSVKERIPLLALSKLVGERQKIDNQQQESVAKIKLAYQEKLKPLLQRASQIIRGGAIKQQEIQGAEQYLKPNQNIKNHLKGKVIESYWNSVLSNSPLVDEVSENDQKALNYLLDIQIVYPQNVKDNANVSLKFVFKENPYFNQTTIVRHLRIKDGQMLALEGDSITWKQGKFLTHQVKKVTNKKTGQTRIEKGKKIRSFFDIFIDYNIQNQAELSRAGNFMIELGSMIVMDSLDYFLGLINFEQISDPQDDDQEEQDEEEPEGQKKIKQN